jgi:hypothetical protein
MRSLAYLVGTILWLLTLTTEVRAQAPPPCLRIKKFWTSYDVLRQGGAIDVKLAWKAHGCLIPNEVNSTPELSNISVAIQDVSGLHAQLGGTGLMNVQNGAAQGLHVDLNVTASPELPLGRRMFLARIDYDALDRKAGLHRERLYTPILIQVVGENAPVKQHYEGGDRWNPWELLALPVNILEYLAESLTGQIC